MGDLPRGHRRSGDHFEPDGYCPVCGGELDHHERCSYGALEAERDRLRGALVAINAKLVQSVITSSYRDPRQCAATISACIDLTKEATDA